jgi:hypothetical protein
LLFLIILAVPGCSVDGVGLARADVVQADGARVIRTQAYGIALRTKPDDAGIAIGYTSTLRVTPDGPQAPPSGSYLFGIATSDLPTVAEVRRVAGLDLDANRRSVGLMLGFSEDATFAAIDPDETVVRHLVLMPDDPASIELRQYRAMP